MKDIRTAILNHKKMVCILGLLFVILLECCVFPKASGVMISLLNIGIIIMGMVLRYFLEYGEVSNTYNFTPKKIAIHMIIMILLSTVFWMQSKRSAEF